MDHPPVVTFEKPFRTNSAVENIKELQKTNPHLTFEREYNVMLTLWTLHDYSVLTTLEKEFGTERAVSLYTKVWELRTRLEWPDLCATIGKKPTDKFTIDDVVNIMINAYADFGNPVRVEERTEDRITLRNYDCPPTTQVLWGRLSRQEALDVYRKKEIALNHTIFDTYLKLAGLYDEWTFNFPCQICKTNQYCEFTFVRNKIPG